MAYDRLRSHAIVIHRNTLVYKPNTSMWQQSDDPHPPFPSDRKLSQAVLALEVLALDEGHPDQLRRDAHSLKCWLCSHANDCDDADWTWVVEHFAPTDEYVTYVLNHA